MILAELAEELLQPSRLSLALAIIQALTVNDDQEHTANLCLTIELCSIPTDFEQRMRWLVVGAEPPLFMGTSSVSRVAKQ